jgi:hypothetical protein
MVANKIPDDGGREAAAQEEVGRGAGAALGIAGVLVAAEPSLEGLGGGGQLAPGGEGGVHRLAGHGPVDAAGAQALVDQAGPLAAGGALAGKLAGKPRIVEQPGGAQGFQDAIDGGGGMAAAAQGLAEFPLGAGRVLHQSGGGRSAQKEGRLGGQLVDGGGGEAAALGKGHCLGKLAGHGNQAAIIEKDLHDAAAGQGAAGGDVEVIGHVGFFSILE